MLILIIAGIDTSCCRGSAFSTGQKSGSSPRAHLRRSVNASQGQVGAWRDPSGARIDARSRCVDGCKGIASPWLGLRMLAPLRRTLRALIVRGSLRGSLCTGLKSIPARHDLTHTGIGTLGCPIRSAARRAHGMASFNVGKWIPERLTLFFSGIVQMYVPVVSRQ